MPSSLRGGRVTSQHALNCSCRQRCSWQGTIVRFAGAWGAAQRGMTMAGAGCGDRIV